VVLKKRERSEPPYISAQRSLLKIKDALSRDFKGSSLPLASFSTTPLASFLGSPPLLSQEVTFAVRHTFHDISRTALRLFFEQINSSTGETNEH